MAIDPGPHPLATRRAILTPDCRMTLKDDSPTFFQELGQFAGASLISRFDFTEPWPTWEMHPVGDEFVYLLSGATRFRLWKEGEAEQVLTIDTPGEYVMVPMGWWHRAEPITPTAMLFVTPGEGTRNEVTPPGRDG